MFLISLYQTDHQCLITQLSFKLLGVNDWQCAGQFSLSRGQQVDDELHQQPEEGDEIVGGRKSFVVVEEPDPDTGAGELPIEFLLVLDLLNSGVHHGDEKIEKYNDDDRLEGGEKNFTEGFRER